MSLIPTVKAGFTLTFLLLTLFSHSDTCVFFIAFQWIVNYSVVDLQSAQAMISTSTYMYAIIYHYNLL